MRFFKLYCEAALLILPSIGGRRGWKARSAAPCALRRKATGLFCLTGGSERAAGVRKEQ